MCLAVESSRGFQIFFTRYHRHRIVDQQLYDKHEPDGNGISNSVALQRDPVPHSTFAADGNFAAASSFADSCSR